MIVDEFYNTRYVNSGDRVHRWCQDTTIDTCGVTRTLWKRVYTGNIPTLIGVALPSE